MHFPHALFATAGRPPTRVLFRLLPRAQVAIPLRFRPSCRCPRVVVSPSMAVFAEPPRRSRRSDPSAKLTFPRAARFDARFTLAHLFSPFFTAIHRASRAVVLSCLSEKIALPSLDCLCLVSSFGLSSLCSSTLRLRLGQFSKFAKFSIPPRTTVRRMVAVNGSFVVVHDRGKRSRSAPAHNHALSSCTRTQPRGQSVACSLAHLVRTRVPPRTHARLPSPNVNTPSGHAETHTHARTMHSHRDQT